MPLFHTGTGVVTRDPSGFEDKTILYASTNPRACIITLKILISLYKKNFQIGTLGSTTSQEIAQTLRNLVTVKIIFRPLEGTTQGGLNGPDIRIICLWSNYSYCSC